MSVSTSPVPAWDAAWEAGQGAAFVKLVPGAIFRGAMPEARSAGFVPGTVEGQCFMRGFVDGLIAIYGPAGVTIDAKGVIQEAG